MTTTTNRINTWANIGTTMKETNVEDVLKTAGLDYNVVTTPVFTEFNGNKIKYPNKVMTVRESDGHPYGIVSERYVPMQNKDAFDFINYIDDDITFVKAGETETGLVYMIGELHEMDILGDKFKTYAIFQNSHNGRYQLAMSICPLRIVCQNQFNLSFKESNSTVLIRHTKSMNSKMAIAADTLNSISIIFSIISSKELCFFFFYSFNSFLSHCLICREHKIKKLCNILFANFLSCK